MNSKPTGQVKRSTPILFCSNRGLHLRCIKSSSTEGNSTPSSSNIPFNRKVEDNLSYSVTFCDLERWLRPAVIE
uniref:Uncharacterized protein n=1 Tax=Glossina palpalis gambiensis TaxID=67801 RepID=A0A1B0BC04_9MUSC